MNLNIKKSLAVSVMFGFVFFFLIIYFAVVGPLEFQSGSIHIIISSIIILIAMLGLGIFLFIIRKEKLLFDERDQLIQKQASMLGLSLTSMFVFLLSIIIFVVNRDRGVVEVSWFWLVGYTTFSFSYFITSIITLYLYVVND